MTDTIAHPSAAVTGGSSVADADHKNSNVSSAPAVSAAQVVDVKKSKTLKAELKDLYNEFAQILPGNHNDPL